MKIEITPEETELLLKCINRAINKTHLFAEEHSSMWELGQRMIKQYQSYNKTRRFRFEFKEDKKNRLSSILG